MNRIIILERILEYYDVPQLFIGKDIIGTRYLCLLVNSDEEYKYITIQISKERLSDFISGKLDLREIFIHPEFGGEYFIITLINQNFVLSNFNDNTLGEDMLPEEGYYYDDEEENSSIIQEAVEQNHPVIHLGFIDSNNSHSIPVTTLASLTNQYQSIVANCFKKIDGNKNDSDFHLRVFGYSAASFNVHMYAESPLNLFGYSRIDNTLRVLDKLFRTSDENTLRDIIEPLKGHTVRSYKNFIKTLIENNIEVKYKWVSSILDNEVIYNRVSIPIMENVYEILNDSEELDREIKEFQGIMIGSHVDNGKWEFRTLEGEERTGITSNHDLYSVT
ncbi:MAG: DUF6575 domain-containing protein [Odoribacter splanchnicus]